MRQQRPRSPSISPLNKERLGRAALGAGMILLCLPAAQAEFVLNWTADTPNPAFSGTIIEHEDPVGTQSTISIPGQTPFLFERVGSYYHLVVGDPAQGFAQEVYIETGNARYDEWDCEGGCGSIGPNRSASGGAGDSQFNPGNAIDPLGSDNLVTGNASANPNRLQMQQFLSDGELTATFVKDIFVEKPSITNEINSPGISTVFDMDSSGNPYTTSATPSAVTITMEILDPDIPEDSASFNLAEDAQASSVTAGQYTYTPSTTIGGMGTYGTYTYIDGTANVNPDWTSYFDHREANPWAYDTIPQGASFGPANKPTPP